MSRWRSLLRGARALFRPGASAGDLEDEVQHYLDQSTEAWQQRGLSLEQARRAARMELGSVTAVQEQMRGDGWEMVLTGWLSDLRYAARRLRNHPASTVVMVLTLALGLGAATAIWSAVSPILFEPLPYPDARRIAAIWDRGSGGGRADVTFASYRELALRSRAFELMAVMRPWQPTLTGAAEPERLDGQRVSQDYFRVLGIGPALGRGLEPDDDLPNGPRIILLSHGLWQRRFAGDSAVIGRQITLNDTPHSIIGILPAGFENVLESAAEVWAPLQYDPSLPPDGREWGHHLRLIGRVRPGQSVADADRELQSIAATPVPEFARMPWASMEKGLLVYPLREDITRDVRPALLAILGAVALLLVIAGVNVTGMLLAQGARRRTEFALRVALGAGRARLIRQMFAESLLLALAGGGLGLLLARAGVAGLLLLYPAGLPRAAAIQLDGMVFGFALLLVTLIGLAVGLAPALHASRANPAAADPTGFRVTPGHHATRRALVVAEVALAMILLVGAGLLFRSLQRLFAIAPGFEPAQLLTLQVHAAGRRYDDDSTTHRFYAQALEAVRQVPGVVAAGFTSQLPLSGDFDKYGVQFESATVAPGASEDGVFRYGVSPGYFETMGIPLLNGRLLDERDGPGFPVAVVINQSYARRRFPGRDPLGERLHLGSTDLPWYTIVGVVGDVKQTSLAVSEADAVYVPASQWYATDRVQSLVVRTRGQPAPLAPAIKQAIWSVDPDQPVSRVRTMADLVTASAGERRFAMVLLQAFALAALVLAAIGIYGVVAGSVAERTREIGVRSALGAPRSGIIALVIRQGLSLTGLGIVLGLAGAVAASRAIASLLFGVSRLDPATHGVVAVLLGAVALAACGIPAWRASRIDPTITLRAE